MLKKTMYLLVMMSCLAYSSLPILASESSEVGVDAASSSLMSGPYCGIVAMYGVLKLEHVPVKFEDILDLKYLSSADGSSIGQLQQLATDYQMKSVVINNLTIDNIGALGVPCILHIKSDELAKKPNHFLIATEAKNGKLTVFDTPGIWREIPLATVERLWDGRALIVGHQLPNMTFIHVKSSLNYLVVFAGLCLLLLILLGHDLGSVKVILNYNILRNSLMILLAGGIVGVASHGNAFSSQPLLEKIQALQALSDVEMRELNIQDVLHAAEQGATLVDTRMISDYVVGHMPGAVSVPVSASDEELFNALYGKSREEKIIVYCQSKNCGFSDAVGKRLLTLGYRNVQVFRSGWEEWNQTVRKNEAK